MSASSYDTTATATAISGPPATGTLTPPAEAPAPAADAEAAAPADEAPAPPAFVARCLTPEEQEECEAAFCFDEATYLADLAYLAALAERGELDGAYDDAYLAAMGAERGEPGDAYLAAMGAGAYLDGADLDPVAYLAGPPDEEIVAWYADLAYPRSARAVFSDPSLYALLCTFCRDMVNVAVGEDGRVAQVFCPSCCTRIGGHAANRCAGGTRNCVGTRFVDSLGVVAPLCAGCHGCGERARRDRTRRRTRRDRRPQASACPAPARAPARAPPAARTPARTPARAPPTARTPVRPGSAWALPTPAM